MTILNLEMKLQHFCFIFKVPETNVSVISKVRLLAIDVDYHLIQSHRVGSNFSDVRINCLQGVTELKTRLLMLIYQSFLLDRV